MRISGLLSCDSRGHDPGSHRRLILPLCWLKMRGLGLLLLAGPAIAAPPFDPSTPVSFFTNVASGLLSAQLNLNLGQLQVYPTNQYTPSVHRLLQVAANILDAQNTNFYPSVFRPLFAKDAANNIFIVGYQPVTNVSGPADPQLAAPYDAAALLNNPGNTTPITDANGPVNVYGVPWVIGAKSGLPNFNQCSLLSAVQVTRKLEVTRDSLDPATAIYETNQMYLIGLSNSIGISFWNPYNASYPRPLTVFAADTLITTLTNSLSIWSQVRNFTASAAVGAWPGSQWSGARPIPHPRPLPFSRLIGRTSSKILWLTVLTRVNLIPLANGNQRCRRCRNYRSLGCHSQIICRPSFWTVAM